MFMFIISWISLKRSVCGAHKSVSALSDRSEIQDALVAQEISLKTTKALQHGETWSHGTPSAVQLQEMADSRVSRHTYTAMYELELN